jgi:hypothetical protein
MNLAVVDVMLPSDSLPPVGGAEARVAAVAKLLPSSPVRPHPGDELDLSISSEIASELAVGDLVAVPASAGERRPFELVAEPRDGWVRARPARDKVTSAVALSEANARDAEFKRRQQRAANARLEQVQEELERGLEALRAAGFHRVADLAQRSGGYEGSLESRLVEDAAELREREAEAAAL